MWKPLQVVIKFASIVGIFAKHEIDSNTAMALNKPCQSLMIIFISRFADDDL